VETPPAASVNTADQIRKAQVELKRVGCFAGRPDGKLNEETRDAVKSYWTHTDQTVVEINITDGFISDVHQHDDRVCKPAHKPEPPAVASRPRPNNNTAARETPAPPREQKEAQRPSSPAPTARNTAQSSPSHAMTGVGF
jgi:hypothetical protein